MWVTFSRDFDFSPASRGGRVTLAYKAGSRHNVTRECAALAEAAGVIDPELVSDDASKTDRRG